jgi:hypothetical protein
MAPSSPISNESLWLTGDIQADRLRRYRTVRVIALWVLWTSLQREQQSVRLVYGTSRWALVVTQFERWLR